MTPQIVATSPISAFTERRQLTVMFTDLVSFTELSQKLDAEDLNAVVHEYYGVCRAMCQHSNGYVANYLGDGVLMFFGYPQAQEDDARRAVQCGLVIVDGIAALNRRLEKERNLRLQVRVGIHTGLMVVGDDRSGNWQQMALGDTLNVAARIQSVTATDTVAISAATHKLVDGYFEFQPLGVRELKGLAQPVEIFRVVSETTARTRLDVAGRSGLTRLMGRQPEVQILLSKWEQNRAGQGHAILLSGEPGIGKSRLVEMLKEEAARVPGAWLTPCQCSPYHQNTAFYPFVDLLQRVVLRFEREESPSDRLSKIEFLVAQYNFDPVPAVPLFASLLSIPPEAGYTPLQISPSEQKRATMDAMLKILFERSQRQPVLFVVEDVHWLDPSTLELLSEIVAAVNKHRLLLVCTSRPEFTNPWRTHPNFTLLPVNRLGSAEIAGMVQEVAHGKHLPPEVLEQIISKTDGVPLFVEELVKMIIQTGALQERNEDYVLTGPLPTLAIPSTLQESLMARLDRLSPVKESAQIGAAIGRAFSYELFRRVHPIDEAMLRTALERLVEVELLYQSGEPPRSHYTFRHALLQETAYASLPKSRRQRYHRLIAATLESHFPQIVAVEPEILAHHHIGAGQGRLAIPYLSKAGEKASERSAHAEAIHHFTKALEILKTLPDSADHIQLEIPLQIGLGVSLTATRGYGAREVEETYSHALKLTAQAGTPVQLFQARYGLWRLHMLRAEYRTACQEAQELLTLAQHQQNLSFQVAAHRSLGATLFYMGDFLQSRQHVEVVINMTGDLAGDTEVLIRDIFDVVDPRVTCRSYRAWSLWMLGFADQARAESLRAIRLADQLKHPFSQVLALSFGAWLAQFCRDIPRVEELSASAIALAQQHGFPFWVGWGQVLQGWAAAQSGAPRDSSVAMIHKGLAYWREKGSELGRGFFFTLLADAEMCAGNWRPALDALGQAQSFADATHERYWDAERLRLKAELIRRYAPANKSEIESCLFKAIQTARDQSARSLQLRATTSLARWWKEQDRSAEARRELAELLGWFTEGADTPDLQEAQALLLALGQGTTNRKL